MRGITEAEKEEMCKNFVAPANVDQSSLTRLMLTSFNVIHKELTRRGFKIVKGEEDE